MIRPTIKDHLDICIFKYMGAKKLEVTSFPFNTTE